MSSIDNLLKFLDDHMSSIAMDNVSKEINSIREVMDNFVVFYNYEGATKSQIKHGIKLLSHFLSKISGKISDFFNDLDAAREVVNFLISTIQSTYVDKVSKELVDIIRCFCMSNFEQKSCVNFIFLFLNSFFENILLFKSFLDRDTYKTIFLLFPRSNSLAMCDLILKKFDENKEQIDEDTSVKFISNFAESLNIVHSNNITCVISFLCSFLVKKGPNVIKAFVSKKGFEGVNRMILTDSKRTGLYLYDRLKSNAQSVMVKNNFPIVKSLISLIPKIKPEDNEFTTNVFKILLLYLKMFKSGCVPIDKDDFEIIKKANISNANYEYFFDILFYNVSKFNFPAATVVETVSKYAVPEFVLQNEVPSFFKLISLLAKLDQKTSFSILYNLFGTSSKEQFVAILEKNPTAGKAFSRIFEQKSTISNQSNLIIKFLTSGLEKTNNEVYMQTFCSLLEIPSIPEMAVGFIATLSMDRIYLINILKSFSSFALKEKRFRTQELTTGLVYIAKTIKPADQEEKVVLLDMIASLSGNTFHPKFDAIIYQYLESVNYYDSSEEEMCKLAFGLLQKQELDCKHKHLVLPSILSKCGNFKITSPYDMTICARYGIDKWCEKTGKTINQFPSIELIAKRFLKRDQIESLLKYPLTCTNSIGSEHYSIPLIEFTRSFNGAAFQINIPEQTAENANKSISFWFMLQEKPIASQKIIQFDSLGLFVFDNQLYCNDFVINSNIALNRWYHIFISEGEESKASIYINSSFINEYSYKDVNVIEICGSETHCNWFIGGSIRVFNETISHESIAKIYKGGVTSTSIDHSNEVLCVSGESFIDHNTYEVDKTKLVSSAMPSVHFSLINYINSSYGRLIDLLKDIEHWVIEGKKEKVKDMLVFLNRVQISGRSSIPNEKFITIMRCFMHLVPECFSKDIFDSLVQCIYVEGGVIDLESFYDLFMDPSIYSLPYAADNIRMLSNILRDINNITIINEEKFLRLFLMIINNITDKEINNECYDLFITYFKDSSIVASALTYIINKDFYQKYFEYFLTTIDKSFDSFELIQALEPKDRTKVMFTYITHFNLCYPGKEKAEMIMRHCLRDVDQINSFSVALSMIIGSPVDLNETSVFDFDEIRPELLPYLFLMISVLLAVHKTLDAKWTEILNIFVDFIKMLGGDVVIDPFSVFAVSQLLCFGNYSEGFVKFPWAPSVTESKTFKVHSRERGQSFSSEVVYVDYTPKYQQESIPCMRETVMKMIPERQMKWTQSGGVTIDADNYIKSIVDEIVAEDDQEVEWKKWSDFFNSLTKKFTETYNNDDLETSIIFLDVVQFVSNILIENFASGDIGPLLSRFTLSTGMMKPKHGQLVLQKVVFNTLTDCSANSLHDNNVITFIAARVMEGWLYNSFAPILSLILLILNGSGETEIPQSVVGMLLTGFELVPQNQFHIFVELFVSFNDFIFNSPSASKPQFNIILLDRIIVHYNIKQDSFDVVLQNFYDHIKENEALKEAWEEIESLKTFSFDNFIEIVDVLRTSGPTGFVEWCKNNHDTSIAFENIRLEFLEQFSKVNVNYIGESIDNITNLRYSYMDDFSEIADKYMHKESEADLISKAVISINKEWYDDFIASDFQIIARKNEMLLSKNRVIEVNESDEFIDAPFASPYSSAMFKVPLPEEVQIPESSTFKLPLFEPYHLNDIRIAKKDKSYIKNFDFVFPFSLSLKMNSKIRTYILRALLNKGEKFNMICRSSILVSSTFVEGTTYVSNTHLYFMADHDSSKVLNRYILSELYGEYILHEGYPMIIVDLVNVFSSYECGVLENEHCLNISMKDGRRIVLSFAENEISQVNDIVKKNNSSLFANLPPIIDQYSHATFAKLMTIGTNEVIDLWKENQIDNFVFISYLNMMSEKSFGDSARLPLFPDEGIFSKSRTEMCEKMKELQKYEEILKWIDETFYLSIDAFEENKEDILNLMTSPKDVFWHQINVPEFSNAKRLSLSDDKVLVLDSQGFVLAPAYKQLFTVCSQRKCILETNLSNQKQLPIAHLNGKVLHKATIFSVSPDCMFFALCNNDDYIVLGDFDYKEGKLTKMNPLSVVHIPTKPNAITVSSAHFLVVAACENSIQRISITTKKALKPIRLDFTPIDVLVDDYKGTLIAVGEKAIAEMTFDGEILFIEKVDQQIKCATIARLPLYVKNRFFITGHVNGSLYFWSNNEIIKTVETGLADIEHVVIDSKSQRVAFCTNNNCYCVSFFGNTLKPLSDYHAGYCCKCGTLLEKKVATCCKCHRFFCSKCYQKKFSIIKPTDWVCSDCQQIFDLYPK